MALARTYSVTLAAVSTAAPTLVSIAHNRGGHADASSSQNRYVTGPDFQAIAGGGYVVAQHDSKGVVVSTSDSLFFEDDAMMPGCNAGFDAIKGRFIKTTSRKVTFLPADDCHGFDECKAGTFCCKDPTVEAPQGACYTKSCAQIPAGAGGVGGEILTIDIVSGRVVHNATMSGDLAHPPFGAFNPLDGLMYSVVPYQYTEVGVFSFDPSTGTVAKLHSFAKEQMDGIGVCEGTIWSGGKHLIYQLGGSTGPDYLTVMDLKTGVVVNRMEGFYGPFKQDPLNKDRLLSLQNVPKHGVKLLSIDPLQNITDTIFSLNSTSLGSNLRAQDQNSLAVDAAGRTLWFVASYNVKSGDLLRGAFTVQLAEDRSGASLVSEAESFGDKSSPWIGRLDYVAAADVFV